ncbi:MAG: hypothetical protein KME03_12705 [Aphanocapsa lilacina HA4352-LM1]|jgi:hypothetical protein|nr:hypothetical protein [Aphanocapsa lilacina HA4352-LM1]
MEWLDNALDSAERLGNKALDSVTHSARAIEDEIDSDHDGSLIDNFVPDLVGKIPVVGEFAKGALEPVAEELGDMTTDILGTRNQGLFSEEGSFDAEKCEDEDYKGDGHFDGFGQAINEEFGIGENNPADLLIGFGAATTPLGILNPGPIGLGMVANELRGREDPFEQDGSDSSGIWAGEAEGGGSLPGADDGAYASDETGADWGAGDFVEEYDNGLVPEDEY